MGVGKPIQVQSIKYKSWSWGRGTADVVWQSLVTELAFAAAGDTAGVGMAATWGTSGISALLDASTVTRECQRDDVVGLRNKRRS